jgi:hypothetical protein
MASSGMKRTLPQRVQDGRLTRLQMHQESGLQFRSYVPTLMELLEDADGMVRDTAKSVVIELFRYVFFIRDGYLHAHETDGSIGAPLMRPNPT